MTIEQTIKQAVEAAVNPLVRKIELLENKIDTGFTEISKKESKPLSINEACELLQCTRPTFYKHRFLIQPCGGTERSPLFYREDVLTLRDKIRNKYD